jgi:hypothetical protein
MKYFSEEEIKKLFNQKVKKDSSYFNKHANLNNLQWKHSNWYSCDMPRNFAVLDFIEWTNKHNIVTGDSLGYTYTEDVELLYVDYKNKTLMEYPPYDLHILHEDFVNKFDFFIFNQTIEHLYNPFLAMENINKYIKQNGYLFTSVPTINISHCTPIHFNGYTPMGLCMLMESSGFEVLEMGQWGNVDYLCKLFSQNDWPNLQKGCSQSNNEKDAVQCWTLVKKL